MKPWTLTGVCAGFLWAVFAADAGTSALTVTLCGDPNVAPVRFAVSEIRAAVQAKCGTVIERALANAADPATGVRMILARAGDAVPGWTGLPAPNAAQGYAMRVRTVGGLQEILVVGADAAGAMYGGLDLADAVRIDALAELANADRTPRISHRGIKFNIPLDARTPSYPDNGDSAQANIGNMWDINFWHEFLDEMARDRFNMLSLWTMAPFPSLVDAPDFPNASLSDVKKTTLPPSQFGTLTGTNMSNSATLANLVTLKTISMANKVQFWRDVMQYAADRGIGTYLFTWNTFTYGTENSGYGFTSSVTDANNQS